MSADNLSLWSSVNETDPAYTKRVNQRGGFTAIDAYYKIRKATAAFGPVGKGWGWTVEYADGPGPSVIARVTLWWGNREQTVDAVGCCAWGSGRIDTDAPKKALTDGITKALSYLGFCADIFLTGKATGDSSEGLVSPAFEGNKYLDEPAPASAPAQVKRPAQRQPAPTQGGSPLTGAEQWLDWELKFGKYKGETYRHFFNAAPGSGHHGYAQWLVSQGVRTSDNPEYQKKNEMDYRRWQQLVAHIESGNAPEPEYEDAGEPFDLDEVPF